MALFRPNQQRTDIEEIKFNTPIELALIDANGESVFIPDASIREGHLVDIEYTKNPIEFGAEVSDHAIILPKSFIVEGRITNVPIQLADDSFSQIYINTETSSRASGAWEFLTFTAERRLPLSIRTNLKTYDNFVLKRLESEQDVRTSQVLDFTAEFEEILFALIPEEDVEQLTVTLPISGETFEQASSPKIRGIISPKTAEQAGIDASKEIIRFNVGGN